MLEYFPNTQFEYIAPRVGDVMYTEANLSKFKAHGWSSSVELQSGLHLVYKRLKDELL